MTRVQPRAGDILPPLQREISLTDMIAYAGSTWDWHRLHYDPAYLAARGLAAPVVDGQYLGALLAKQAQDWLGPRAFLRRLHFRFRNLVFAGETVCCSASVTAVERLDAATLVTIEARIDVVGGDPRIAVVPAGAEIVVWP